LSAPKRWLSLAEWGQDRDQAAPRVTDRADIPGGDAVTVRRLSGPRDALSVRSYWTFYAGEWNLFKPDSTPITRYTKVIGKHSPYDPTLRPYWAERNAKQVITETFSTGRRVLHQRQESRCALCNLPFVPGERIQCDHLIFQYRGGSDDLDNKRLVHPWCHMQHHQRIGFKGPRLEPDEG
jgi:HNH endonuclease